MNLRPQVLVVVFLLVGACNSKGGCGPEEPSAPGEDCNFAAKNSDGCDGTSACLNGVCAKLCTSNRDCGGGECKTYVGTYTGDTTHACSPPAGGSTGGGTGSGGSSGGCVPNSRNCTTLTNQCTSNSTAQAACYCAAACACANSCDSCEQSNRASAQQLGTTCSY